MTIDKYLRVKQICEITGFSRATIYALEKVGKFPKKTVLGARAVAWRESEIKKWIDERATETKIGREAKPGRPPSSKKSTAAASDRIPDTLIDLQNTEAPAANGATHEPSPDLTNSIDDVWEDDVAPSEGDMAAARAKLVRNASAPRPDPRTPVKRTSTRIDVRPLDTNRIKKAGKTIELTGFQTRSKKT